MCSRDEGLDHALSLLVVKSIATMTVDADSAAARGQLGLWIVWVG